MQIIAVQRKIIGKNIILDSASKYTNMASNIIKKAKIKCIVSKIKEIKLLFLSTTKTS